MIKFIAHSMAAISLAAAFAACDETDYGTYYSDISIEDPVSIWEVSGFYSWGMKLGGDHADENANYMSHYLFFNEDGKGTAYTYRQVGKYPHEAVLDSVQFSYKTDDACHFEITTANGTNVLAFAKETYWGAGQRESSCVIYWTEEKEGYTACRWHRCEELRSDTALYLKLPDLRGRGNIPKNRVWRGKSIVGEYSDLEYKTNYKTLEFFSDGKFIFNKGSFGTDDHNKEYNGQYRIKEGVRDSIFFTFDDGREEAYQIIIDNVYAFLYKDGSNALRLQSKINDCGY